MAKKIMIIENHHVYAYNLRGELTQTYIDQGYEVYLMVPHGERVADLKAMGCHHIPYEVNRHGLNPFQDLKLFFYFLKQMKEVKPDVVLTYTVKPNIYGSLAARIRKIPYICNITGLGMAVENKSLLQKLLIFLYRIALGKANCVFFQNTENREFFEKRRIAMGKHRLIPGSGVNTTKFSPLEYPESDKTEFVFISRLMKEKGVDQYIGAANIIKQKYPDTVFHVCGFCEKEYESQIESLMKADIVTYHGIVKDVREILKRVHCTVHPTYYPEGMSNVLLESAASLRPLITTNRSGCREIIEDGVNGYIVRQQDTMDVVAKIEQFLQLPWEEKKKMGQQARRKVEREFDRSIVINAYLEEIVKCVGGAI